MDKHLPEVFSVKAGAEEFPLMVVLGVSYVCNSKCPACPYTQSTIRKSYKDTPFMGECTFKRIADECGKYNSFMRLSGGGEPLLHPLILYLIEYAKFAGAKVGLITNGSKLTTSVADRLLAISIDVIEVSADAANLSTYQRVRPGLDFELLVKNTLYLVGERNRLQSPTKIVASIVNQKALDGKLDSTITFWKGIVDEVQVRKYLTWGIGDSKQSGDSTPYLKERVPCPFPFERLNIDTRGDVTFCGFDIASETNFGNVNETTIKDIWVGSKFSSWRRLLLEGRYEEIDICKKCPDWRYRSWNYNYWSLLSKAERKRAEEVLRK